MTETHAHQERAAAPRKTAKDLPWKLRGFLALVFGAIIGSVLGAIGGLANFLVG